MADLISRLSQINVLTGIILCATGFAIILLSKKIGKIVSKQTEIEADNKPMLVSKALGLTMVCVAMVLMIIV